MPNFVKHTLLRVIPGKVALVGGQGDGGGALTLRNLRPSGSWRGIWDPVQCRVANNRIRILPRPHFSARECYLGD